MNILRLYLLNIGVVLLEAPFLATGLLREKDNRPSSNQIDSAQVDRDSELVTKNEVKLKQIQFLNKIFLPKTPEIAVIN